RVRADIHSVGYLRFGKRGAYGLGHLEVLYQNRNRLGGSNRRYYHDAVTGSKQALELRGGIICQEIEFLVGQRQDGDTIRGKLSGNGTADKSPGSYNDDPARLGRNRILMLKHVVKAASSGFLCSGGDGIIGSSMALSPQRTSSEREVVKPGCNDCGAFQHPVGIQHHASPEDLGEI